MLTTSTLPLTVTLHGHRFTVRQEAGQIRLNGGGRLNRVYLPANVNWESHDEFRTICAKAVKQAREHDRKAQVNFQAYLEQKSMVTILQKSIEQVRAAKVDFVPTDEECEEYALSELLAEQAKAALLERDEPMGDPDHNWLAEQEADEGEAMDVGCYSCKGCGCHRCC